MLLTTFFRASMHSIVRYLTAALHPVVIVLFRSVIGLVVILPLIAKGGIGVFGPGTQTASTTHAYRRSAMLSCFYALSKVPITNATALSFSATIFAPQAALIILGERMRIRRWLAIVTGLNGVVVVPRPGLDLSTDCTDSSGKETIQTKQIPYAGTFQIFLLPRGVSP